jgi:hypothetical protein
MKREVMLLTRFGSEFPHPVYKAYLFIGPPGKEMVASALTEATRDPVTLAIRPLPAFLKREMFKACVSKLRREVAKKRLKLVVNNVQSPRLKVIQ